MLNNIQNILMIRRGAFGDIMFTLPAYYMLKANFPCSKISYLVKESYVQVLQGFPGLDEILIIKKEEYTSKNLLKVWKTVTGLLHTIKEHHFQLVVDFVGHGEQAFLLWASKIEHRWGSIKTSKPVRQCLYTNYFIRNLEKVHFADQHLQLLEKGGLTMFPVNNQYVIPKENLEKAQYLFESWGLALQKPTLYIQPFTGDGIIGKIWPLDRYVMLADYWQKQGIQVLFGGGPEEREQLNFLSGRFPIAAGQADFVTSIALTALSSVVLGGDTGLLHAAVAAGKRVVMLVGPTNFYQFGPYQHPEWAITPPSGNKIEDIGVERVIEATTAAVKDKFSRKEMTELLFAVKV
jgi:ADP-heptose:LPS heptosyltransferase